MYTSQWRSVKYRKLRKLFKEKLRQKARKYTTKIVNEVRERKRGPGYKAIRKLGNSPDEREMSFTIPSYIEMNLSP